MGLKVKRPLRVNVAEFGSGRNPLPLLAKYFRGLSKGRARHFTAVDTRLLVPKSARAGKIEGQRGRLKYVRGDAIKELEKMKPRSKHVIFSSFLLNCMAANSKLGVVGVVEKFFSLGKKALVPGGRLVTIIHKVNLPFLARVAKEFGFEVYYRGLTQKEMDESELDYVQKRATPEKREVLIKIHLDQVDAQRYMIREGLKSAGDLEMPGILFLKKPRVQRKNKD
ncbi:MAG: class I SAM-dependent methyltransferase [archaeon]|jgi:hypothetical protein